MIEFINPSAPSFKSASINQVLARIMGDQDKKTTTNVQTLFAEQGWFWRAVDIRAKAIQNLPWHITRVGSEEPVWDCDMPDIPDELAFASDLPTMLYLWEACLVTARRTYTLKESEGRGIDGLHYFNPMKVEPVKDSARGIYQYKRMVNGSYEYYDVDDVIAIFSPDPFVENGPSSVLPGKKNAEVLRALEGFLHSFLDKGAIKATLLTVDGATATSEEDRGRLKDAWNRLVGGWKNGGKAEIFNSKVIPHTIGEGLKDMGTTDLTKSERESICAALGIPLSLMMSNAANFATAELDQVGFIKNTVEPSAKHLMRSINDQLFVPAGFRFVFEPKKLEVLQRYELDKAAKVMAVVGGPVLTQDEGRELLGYKPLTASQDAPEDEQDTPQAQTGTEEATDDVGGSSDDVKALMLEVLHLKEMVKSGQVRYTVDSDQLLYGVRRDGIDLTNAKYSSDSAVVAQESRQSDIKNWKRRIKKKDNRQVRFDAVSLKAHEVAAIRERLETDMPLSEVFEGPFVNF